MLANKFKFKKGILLLGLIVFIFSLFTLGVFAGDQIFGDNSISTIRVGGQSDHNLTIFRAGDHLWYPGVEYQEILRIQNEHESKVIINALGMNIDLVKNENEIDSTTGSGKYYMDNMRINVEYKNPIKSFLNGSIFDENHEKNQNFINSFTEFTEGVNCSIELSPNDYVDLVYTVKMNEKADVTLAGITGKVDFVISIAGEEASSRTGGRDSDPKNEDEELVEEHLDINGHWAEECILRLIEEGIIVGYPDETIKPDNTITRAETAVLVARALKLVEKDKFFSGYIDPIPKWARGYIIATTEEGIFEGYPVVIGKVFRPNRLITREEMAAVLMRGFEVALQEDISLDFNDKDNISDWALEYVKAGVQKEIILGYPDDSFKPQNNITRAEAFTMICKLLGYNK